MVIVCPMLLSKSDLSQCVATQDTLPNSCIYKLYCVNVLAAVRKRQNKHCWKKEIHVVISTSVHEEGGKII